MKLSKKFLAVCAVVMAVGPAAAFASTTLDVFFDSSTVSLGSDKKLPVYVHCDSDKSTCHGTVKATAKIKGHKRTIASGVLEVTSGNAGQVDLKFSSKATQALKKGSLSVTVKAKVGSATDTGKVKVTK